MISKSPLETWAARKINGAAGKDQTGTLTRDRIEAYQCQKLRETLSLARKRSPFYRRLLQDYPAERLQTLADWQKIPFTTAEALRQNPLLFLCVSQDQINRVVTLPSSGTTGLPKRVFLPPATRN